MSHTTLSIDKTIYQESAKRAKSQGLSTSAVARMLLKAYAEGRIDIMPVYSEPPLEIRRLEEDKITPEIKTAAKKARKINPSKLVNIPT